MEPLGVLQMRFGSAMGLARRICPTDRCFRVVSDISRAYCWTVLGWNFPAHGAESPCGKSERLGLMAAWTTAGVSGSVADVGSAVGLALDQHVDCLKQEVLAKQRGSLCRHGCLWVDAFSLLAPE